MWPFRQRAAATGYSTLRVAELEALAGTRAVDAGAVAAVSIAGLLYERALVAATIEAQGFAFPASLRGLIGRSLVDRGEFLAAIEIDPDTGRPVLLPAASWDVTGGPVPETWHYKAELTAPSATVTRRYPAEGVVHVRLNAAASQPWKGRAPWAVASGTSALAGRIEKALEREAGIPVGKVASLPDLTSLQMEQFQKRLEEGGMVIVSPHVVGGQTGTGGHPLENLGPAPTAPLVALREAVQTDVLAACGVLSELVHGSTGSNTRETTRRWRVLHLEAIGDAIREELEAKLEREVRLDWNQIETPDSLAQRARVVKDLQAAGMPLGDARGVAGLS